MDKLERFLKVACLEEPGEVSILLIIDSLSPPGFIGTTTLKYYLLIDFIQEYGKSFLYYF